MDSVNEKRAEIADRVRALLANEPTLEEKRMFGSLAFMVDERMLVAAWGEGHLLVRVDPERSAELQRVPGVSIAEMGPSRRSMGPSWLDVRSDVLAGDDQLLFWIDTARQYHAASRDS